MKPIIEIRNISKSFVSKNNIFTKVLDDCSLDIYENEFVAIMGPSGAGKSTLLYILGLLDKAEEGIISFIFNGSIINPNKMSDKKLSNFRNSNLGFIFQFYHLLPEFTALENVMIPSILAGNTQKDAMKNAKEMINNFKLIDKINNKPNELSGGEQQRIAIARSLINNPKIILADEPTGNLDSKNADLVLDNLHKIKSEYKITMIMATHSNEIANQTDRILFLKDGKITNYETN